MLTIHQIRGQYNKATRLFTEYNQLSALNNAIDKDNERVGSANVLPETKTYQANIQKAMVRIQDQLSQIFNHPMNHGKNKEE